jgi:hypothetical protein
VVAVVAQEEEEEEEVVVVVVRVRAPSSRWMEGSERHHLMLACEGRGRGGSGGDGEGLNNHPTCIWMPGTVVMYLEK